MKLVENWKRFWTLNRHHAAGFTLVELIVVIAILAILAGVAVPAYSGYVTQANMTADQALVSEVVDALQLYYYNGNVDGSGYVILYPGDAPAQADEFGAAAMNTAFGADWQESLSLKYDGWEGSSMTSVALKQGLEDGLVGSVGTSAFLTGSTPEELLNKVTDLTFVATGLFEDMNDEFKYSAIMGNLFNNDSELLQEYCEKFGITTSNTAGGTVFGSDVTNEQLSNLLVFGAAQQITNGTDDSMVTGLVYQYAACTAFVNSQKDNPAAQEALATLNEQLAKDNTGDTRINSEDILTAFGNFMENEAIKDDFAAYQNDENPQYINDMNAFISIMGAVDQASGDVTPEEMQDKDFFTSDKVSGFFDTYIAAADAVSKLDADQIRALQDAVANGGIAIFLYGGPILDCSSQEAWLPAY